MATLFSTPSGIRTTKRLLWGILALAALIIWSAGIHHRKVAPSMAHNEPGFALKGNPATHAVELQSLTPRIDVMGTVESEEKINLGSRIPAYIKRVHVSAGQAVKAGQLLIELDDREIREQQAAAEAQFKQADIEFQRSKQLLENKASTEQAFTSAESIFMTAKAQLDRIKVMLTYAQITSPIDGIVTDRRIEVGDLANPGQILLAVYDSRNMRLEAPVPVRLIDHLKLNQEVEINLERPSRPFKGRVTHIVSEIDPSSRTQKVKILIEGVAGDVLPGTFGRLWVEEEPRNTIRVPATAVYRVGQLELVQVVKEGRALRRLVKTGPAIDLNVEILSGLNPGDVILVNPVKEG